MVIMMDFDSLPNTEMLETVMNHFKDSHECDFKLVSILSYSKDNEIKYRAFFEKVIQ